MDSQTIRLSLLLALASVTAFKGADWLTDAHDPQRSGWQTDETILTTSNVGRMKLLWKIDTGNPAGGRGRNLFPPLIVGRVGMQGNPAGGRGLPPLIVGAVGTQGNAREIAILAGVGDGIYAIDVAKGVIIWKKHFDSGGITGSCPTLATPVIVPASPPGKYTLYALSHDGRLHQMNVADGEDIAPPELFIPPNAQSYALNYFNGVIYSMTGNNCGGHPNIVYAYDLKTFRTANYSDGSGGMWDIRGPAVGADGTAYEGTGDGVFDPAHGMFGDGIIGVRQNPQTKALEMPKYFGPSNAEYLDKRDLDVNVTPTIFTYKGREYLVGSSKECRLWLLDTSNFGGEDHRTAVYRTPLICNEFSNYFNRGVWGGLSNWVDSNGTQWVVTPFWGPKHSEFSAPIEYGTVVRGALAAFKVEDKNGKVQLTPAWISRDMDEPDPPVIANGIVFGNGTGADTTIGRDDVPAGTTPSTAARGSASTHSTLYALDGLTGKELWSSGDEIKSFNHQSGLSVANGRVYVGTYDGIEYCFGIAK